MIVPAAVLVALALAVDWLASVAPSRTPPPCGGPGRLQRQRLVQPAHRPPDSGGTSREHGVTALTLAGSFATPAGSILLTGRPYRRRLPRPRWLGRADVRLTPILDSLQSGIVNDEHLARPRPGLLGGGLAVGLR